MALGKPTEALAEQERARAIREKQAASDPAVHDYREAVAHGESKVAEAIFTTRRASW